MISNIFVLKSQYLDDSGQFKCALCRSEFPNLQKYKIHLLSKQHIQLQKDDESYYINMLVKHVQKYKKLHFVCPSLCPSLDTNENS